MVESRFRLELTSIVDLNYKSCFGMIRFMNKPDSKPSSRRSLYQKFSDKVFSLTGMPVGRVLTAIVGILFLGWAILFATHGEEQPSNLKSKITKKEDFLAAITVPQNFFETVLPIQIEKLNSMVERCDQLLNQKSEYSEKVEEKRLSLLMLKAITLADNGLDPTPTLDLFQNSADQIASSVTQQDKYQYLVAATYMEVLAADPESDFHTQATAAISGIQETTPVPQFFAKLCFESAKEYYQGSKDRVKSGKLLRSLGKKIAMAKDPSVSDWGFSLMDYPDFFSAYQRSTNHTKSGQSLESETDQLLKQLRQTPPQSQQTYDVLLNVPEQHLHAGNKKIALSVLEELTSLASSSDSRISDYILPKALKLKTRIDLLNKPFPLSGLDVAGRTIGPPDKESTVIFFYNPFEKNSVQALRRFATSPLLEGSSTTLYLVSVVQPSEDHILAVKESFPDFISIDRLTSENWFEKSGIDQVPYLIKLDKAGVVRDLEFP